MKVKKKESIVDIRLTRIEAQYEAQRSDPILAKIIAAKEEEKDLPEMRYPQKVLLQNHIGRYGTA